MLRNDHGLRRFWSHSELLRIRYLTSSSRGNWRCRSQEDGLIFGRCACRLLCEPLRPGLTHDALIYIAVQRHLCASSAAASLDTKNLPSSPDWWPFIAYSFLKEADGSFFSLKFLGNLLKEHLETNQFMQSVFLLLHLFFLCLGIRLPLLCLSLCCRPA